MRGCAENIRAMCPLFQEGKGGSIPTSALQLRLEEIAFDEAKALNNLWHSTLPRFGTGSIRNPRRRFLCFAAEFDGLAYAVGIWSKPAARKLPQDGTWFELRRFAIAPDAPRNTASRMLRIMALLIGRARPRIEMLTSYQDIGRHTGAIYKAAGWKKTATRRAGEWDCKSRPRLQSQSKGARQRWEKTVRAYPGGPQP